MATSPGITADAAGTWTLGDLTVNRLGFGAMRLPARAAFQPGAPSRDLSAGERALLDGEHGGNAG